ncbi:hypothetical protein RRG08_018297 [Elysia crispata]|uniref:G-protein coupled receptors family 1 profile domain-containing protein n=1 Tax=Elysia crispata TaxID=231223 RepID=A0AAE0YK12_9GAST|nr:hypothetical protein RRG08_018297 [Elysia crispata]
MFSVKDLNASASTLDIGSSPGLINGPLFWQVLNVVLTLDILAAMFATGANILTIIVYRRVGYAESINISLSALAISDLGVAVTTIICVLAILLPTVPNSPFTYEIFVNLGAYPHMFFTRASALITAYISVERYLCVFLPLRVKGIFTTNRTLTAMIVIFFLTFSPIAITLLSYPLGWSFSPEQNRTVLTVLPVNDSIILTSWYIIQVYIALFLPVLTFVTVSFSTVFLTTSLRRSQVWRDANRSTAIIAENNRNAASSKGTRESATNSKEKKAVKMVIAIAVIFIVATIPSCVNMIAITTIPGFTMRGRFSHLYTVSGMTLLFVDSLNSGGNVIIYLFMSSRFKETVFTMQCGKSLVSQKR